jgi:hypothetical protein
MKYLTMIVGIFIATIVLMNLLFLLNEGSNLMNLTGIIGIFLLVYVTIKTKVFTQFKTKQ